jgi:hypothetical protein
MLKVFAVAVALLLATPALAEDWFYEGGNIPIAYVDNGAAQFHFACRGGELAMGYWVRSPERQVAGAASMNLALTVAGDTSFAQDMPLIHVEGSSMIIRGPVARQWARIARQARDSLEVAYAHKGAGGLEYFDGNAFGAKGSSAAIGKVLDRCG